MKCRSRRALRRSMSAMSRFALSCEKMRWPRFRCISASRWRPCLRHSSACSRAVSADSSRSRRSTAICLRALEVLLGQRQLAQLARDRAEVLLDLAERDRVVRLRRERHRELARGARRDEVAARDLELGAIDFDQDARRHVAERVGDLHRLLEGARRVVPALEVRAQHAHVVERDEHFLRRAERAEFREARAIVAQRLLVIAAHHGDDAEILRGHRGEARLAGVDRVRARLEIQRLGLVEIALLLMDDRLHVDRVPDRAASRRPARPTAIAASRQSSAASTSASSW